MHDAVTAGWDAIGSDWSNQAKHDALVQLAIQHNELKWLASKYREKKGDAVADAQLVKLTNAAMATMFATATAKKEVDAAAPYKRALLWLLLLLVMLVLGMIAVKLMASAHHPDQG